MNLRYTVPLAFVCILGCSGPGTAEKPKGGIAPVVVGEANPLGIPEELVTDGLKLMGYPFNKQITYKVTGYPAAGQSSDQTFVPSYDKDKKVLTFDYDGSVSMPSESYELRPDGVYGIALGADSIEPPFRAVPSILKEGDSWTNKGSIKQQTELVIDILVTLKGTEKVKVPAGEYDATVLVETGTVSASGTKLKVVAKGWYVSGVGAVKKSVTQTDPSGKASSISIEAVTVR